MLFCVAGDVHGKISLLYQKVLAFEDRLNVRFDGLLQVGDFGIWPDLSKIDNSTKINSFGKPASEQSGDFAEWWAAKREVPIPTLFVKGNHEDFDFLYERKRQKKGLLPGLRCLPNGEVWRWGPAWEKIRVAGVGGCYGFNDYVMKSEELTGRMRRHFTFEEVRRLRVLCEGQIDVLLLHDAPEAMDFGYAYPHRAEGLDDLIRATKPKVVFCGHHHKGGRATVAGVPVINLPIFPNRGSLLAVYFNPDSGRFKVIGEGP
jgi:Icc-related predicted phosphoesterase